ncbi:sigma-54-dependent transcriptional regulator [Rhodospira trueperi]|uniref:DNA-binding transcriptional response regulator, NtrC family, contains REC, AAA-type ATPase, and a Fis-type DNA-binding domains n=1 Tax=Rhodospira trueperi TaxID=69960 RepID=A0A1G6YR92_9PROT|nr:sigma-54 dependent transcriptional regulator [Rhodospira trueperi]SDD92820.1 DNA-binding transcriptional response regulator, NtrC family, contains REC, AAA-type ATPase, and a Fis-type DNA-binding domains [Rhodospira trueperi]
MTLSTASKSASPVVPPEGRVLLVEDTPSMARVYIEYLSDMPWPVDLAETGEEARRLLAQGGHIAVILDLRLPDASGIDILREIRGDSHAETHEVAVVVVTSQGSMQVAVEAMREGADDFLTKPFAPDRLRVTLKNAIERHAMTGTLRRIRKEIGREAFHGFIGSSLAMQAVYRTIEAAAPSRASVFITGESGTGKEVCAEALHRASARAKGPFVAINCAAIPHELIESEVFGHVKGAFTGATADRQGAAARANGGTLFLDEICEMDLGLQAKLLRFIQTGTFLPVGGTRVESVDVRFICATNRDPWDEVQNGRFREDLYFRLHVIPIHLPPLRERDVDVVEIARGLLARFSEEEGRAFTGFTPEAEALLVRLGWPGNVRQLQNVLRNVIVLNEGPLVTEAMLEGPTRALPRAETPAPPPEGAPPAEASTLAASAAPGPGPTPGDPLNAMRQSEGLRPMWQVEWEHMTLALKACQGNVPRAAALLEVSPSTIYRRIRQFGDPVTGAPPAVGEGTATG